MEVQPDINTRKTGLILDKKHCIDCKKWYRFERMYTNTFEIGPHHGKINKVKPYLCKRCANGLLEADRKFTEWKETREKLPVPPPPSQMPPKKRKR
ncbi:MAG: hypothetical protein GY757_30835 [bacterium]|nr:hypothetical protein [bacterium]